MMRHERKCCKARMKMKKGKGDRVHVSVCVCVSDLIPISFTQFTHVRRLCWLIADLRHRALVACTAFIVYSKLYLKKRVHFRFLTLLL